MMPTIEEQIAEIQEAMQALHPEDREDNLPVLQEMLQEIQQTQEVAR